MRRAIQAVVIVLLLATCGGGSILPAILYVREAAKRIECANNLHQLGLAVANYHDTYSRYPLGAMPNADLPPDQRLSWLVAIMPFIEANDIYSRMDKKAGWDAEENRFAALLTIKPFQCPGYPEKPPVSTLSPSHYIGISGVGEDAASLPADDTRSGFFGYERTLQVTGFGWRRGEIAVATETSAAQGAWTAAGLPTVRGYDPAAATFGGNHRRHCNVLFADGSVRGIDPAMSDAEWRRLVVLAGEAPPD
jgi:prepilin-type processing-associated H-X9-DG protein